MTKVMVKFGGMLLCGWFPPVFRMSDALIDTLVAGAAKTLRPALPPSLAQTLLAGVLDVPAPLMQFTAWLCAAI